MDTKTLWMDDLVRTPHRAADYVGATCTSARIALHASAIPHQPGIAELAAQLALELVHPPTSRVWSKLRFALLAAKAGARLRSFHGGRVVAEEGGRAGGG
jgi:hypothetical protein